MSFDNWLVPELSLSAEAEVEAGVRAIMNNAKSEPENVAALACSTLRLAAHRQSIIQKAIDNTAELELRLMLAQQHIEAMEAANGVVGPVKIPRLLRLIMQLFGFRFLQG